MMNLEKDQYIIVEVIPTHSKAEKGTIAQLSALKLEGLKLLDRFDYRLKDDSLAKESAQLREAVENTKKAFEEAMDDDFNVQNALAAIYAVLPLVNANVNEKNVDKEELRIFKELLSAWLNIFGIDCVKLTAKKAASNDEEIEELVRQRDEARKNKNWAVSDQLRDQLKEMGVTIQDTPQGTRWTRD